MTASENLRGRATSRPRRLGAAQKGPVFDMAVEHVGIPVDRDRSFRFVVTGDSGGS